MERRLRHPLSTKAISHMCRRLFLEVGIEEIWPVTHPLTNHDHPISHSYPSTSWIRYAYACAMQFQGLPCPVMVAGCNEECSSGGKQDEGPKLYWMDTLGAIQRLRLERVMHHFTGILIGPYVRSSGRSVLPCPWPPPHPADATHDSN